MWYVISFGGECKLEPLNNIVGYISPRSKREGFQPYIAQYKFREGSHWKHITIPQSRFIPVCFPTLQMQPIEMNVALENLSEVVFNLSSFRVVVVQSLGTDVNRYIDLAQ